MLAKIRDQRPDGLLVAPLDPFASQWEALASQLPVVAIGDRLAQAPSAGAVVFDNAAGFALVFDHLAELGHRRIAAVLPERPSTPDRPAERWSPGRRSAAASSSTWCVRRRRPPTPPP